MQIISKFYQCNNGGNMRVLLFIIFVLMANPAGATVYVLYNADNTVQSIDSQNDAIVMDGQQKAVLDTTEKQLNLLRHDQDYLFVDGEFVINRNKIDARNAEKVIRDELNEELRAVEKKVREMAFDELKTSGKTFKRLKKTDL